MCKSNEQPINIPGWIKILLADNTYYENIPVDNIASIGSFKYDNKVCREICFKQNPSSNKVLTHETELEIMEKIHKAQCNEVTVSGHVIKNIPTKVF